MSSIDFLSSIFKRNKEEIKEDIVDSSSGAKIVELGTSGIQNYSGYIDEDYLKKLSTPREFAEEYDEMMRKCDAIGRVLEVIKAPLKSATWEVSIKKQFSENPKAEKQLELYQYLFFEDSIRPKGLMLNEWLSVFDYGFAVFEETYKVVKSHSMFGPHIGLKSFKWLNPKTIERWNINRETEELESVDQYAYGDAGKLVSIPADWITHITINRKGQDFNGISILRNLYGPYQRKENAEKFKAIGIEKYALGVLLVEVENYGNLNDEEKALLLKTVQSYGAGNKAGIVAPTGTKMTLADVTFDPEKLQKSVDAESVAMMKRVLAGFQELGGSKGGAFALSKDLSDMFLGSLQNYANTICGFINKGCLKRLHEYNSSDELMVELTCRGVTDRLGENFAKFLKILADGNIITPDDKLEEDVRTRANLPARDESTSRSKPTQEAPPDDSEESEDEDESSKASEVFTLSEKKNAYKIIKDGDKNLLEVAERQVTALFESAAKQIIAHHESKKTSLIEVELSSRAFLDETVEVLNDTHSKSLSLHKSNYERRSGNSLSEKFAKPKSKVPKMIRNLGRALIITQLADVKKLAIASYLTRFAADPESKVTAIGFHIKRVGEKHLKSSSLRASIQNTVTASSTQASRDFSKELNKSDDNVVSYTFSNPAPVAQICKELKGRTIRADNPELEEWMPPLHHLCRTSVIINTEKTKNNPKPEAKVTVSKRAMQSATLIN